MLTELKRDWKKLTFYYFADSYINFNSLVTDLFKIYKTRIWMSAINPASFVTPSAGLQLPSGIGPGAVGHDHDQFVDARMPKENLGFAATSVSPANPSIFSPSWNNMPDPSMPAPVAPTTYAQLYQRQGFQSGSPKLQDYGRGVQPNMRSGSPFNSQPFGSYMGNQQHMYGKPDPKTGLPRNAYLDPLSGWSSQFQGLSLGS